MEPKSEPAICWTVDSPYSLSSFGFIFGDVVDGTMKMRMTSEAIKEIITTLWYSTVSLYDNELHFRECTK